MRFRGYAGWEQGRGPEDGTVSDQVRNSEVHPGAVKVELDSDPKTTISISL